MLKHLYLYKVFVNERKEDDCHPHWNEKDAILCLYYTKFFNAGKETGNSLDEDRIGKLGCTVKQLAEEYIGATVISLKKQSECFKYIIDPDSVESKEGVDPPGSHYSKLFKDVYSNLPTEEYPYGDWNEKELRDISQEILDEREPERDKNLQNVREYEERLATSRSAKEMEKELKRKELEKEQEKQDLLNKKITSIGLNPNSIRPLTDISDIDIDTQYEPGQTVESEKFGRGTVVSVDGGKITVNFETAGTKTLLSSLAKLKIV